LATGPCKIIPKKVKIGIAENRSGVATGGMYIHGQAFKGLREKMSRIF
jgi:hypothetical protein